MKKMTKNMVLSLLTVATLGATAAAAITLTANPALVANAATATEETDFRMVDGASIRMVSPLGLRFMAEMEEKVYEDLMQEESGVSKKMGMFIVPYSYINGYTNNYHNLATKIDLVFYDSEGSVENKIYEHTVNGETVYRANGVIQNIYLHNYAKDFIGIGYIAETVDGKTTYTYADFDAQDNVRNAAYVAIEAYEDYTDKAPRDVFSQYVWGAHLYDIGMTQESDKVFIYNNTEYESVWALAENLTWSLSIDQSLVYIKEVGSTYQLNATVMGEGEVVDFNGMHVNWTAADKNIIKINDDGKMTALAEGVTTVTASFMGHTKSCKVIVSKIDFENDQANSYFAGSRVQSLTTTALSTGKALQAQTTTDSTSDVGVHVKLDLLHAIFADPTVEYMAFDLLSGAGRNGMAKGGPTVYYHNDGSSWARYETGEYDALPTDAFKSYYFTRSEYNDWVSKNVTNGRFLMIGGGLVCGGESFYIDNVRGVTAEEYAHDWYSFEYGGLRTNNGNTPLFYSPSGGQWDLGFSGIDSTTAKFTNEIVSDGNRALQFTKIANTATNIVLNGTTDTDKEKELRKAGYISYDLYVPEGSDARFLSSGDSSFIALPAGWNTVYAHVDATDNTISHFYDTTGSTYVIDNIRFMTASEYLEKVNGMETTGALRLDRASGSNKGTAYLYSLGRDIDKSVYSLAITSNVTDIHYDDTIKHSGDYSLSFTKEGDVYLQFRADSEAYADLHNGFTFWMYSTSGVNGTGTANFVNGYGQKLNNGDGISIPKNTWTKITVTKDDIVQQAVGYAGEGNSCAFLRIAGSTNGAYYIDDIQPLPTPNTITLVSENEVTTRAGYNGYNYKLPIPDNYLFLGWYDEDGNQFANSGVWTKGEDITLTARYEERKTTLDFEDGYVPIYLTKGSQTAGLSVVTLNGNKVLKMQGGATGKNHALNVPLGFLNEVFADPNVQYLAFDVKSETTQHTNFRRSTIRTTGETTIGKWGQEPYEADVQADNTQVLGYRADAFKTFFFSRTDYNNWVNNNKTVEMLISAGNFASGENLYVDNIRPVTQAQYNAANYGLETGGIRPNGGNLLVYYANTGSTWQYAITADSVSGVRPTFSNFGYTNENVTEGNRALIFTKTAGQVTLRFNSTDVANFKAIANATGYYAFDLYVGEGSDASIVDYAPIQSGWMTIYCQNDTHVCVKITDTTGGTYGMDNFRSVTAEEFKTAQYGFEKGTMNLSLKNLGDETAHSGAAYVYYTGADASASKPSLSIAEGNVTNDMNAVSNVRIDYTNAHSGSSCLAFDKGNGYMYLTRHGESQAVVDFSVGFTFWIYSTVEIDGVNTKNFVNGVNGKFNGGAGIIIPANTWTQVTVQANEIGNGRFLIMQGNWSGTIYIDDFQPLA